MSKKFTFIGAGSLGFTRDLIRDILTFDAFRDAEFALMDIDEKRLTYSKNGAEKLIRASGYPASVTATTNRAEALQGADGVLITILQGGVDVWRHDIEIPASYGVDICVGDTRGPSGIFRFLRTAPAMLEIIRDVEKYCPNAIVLNYTNPMAMLCRYLQDVSKVCVTGLCHSVQGTAEMLARWIGADMADISYTCAGINHQAFYTDYRWKGTDAYPLISKALERPEIANEELVRNEMFRQLGYYTTESSGHNSEYNPWFRKRKDLVEKYCTHGTGWNPGHHAYILQEYMNREDTWESTYTSWLESDEINLNRGQEYAAYIFNAVFGDNQHFEFNGNVRNFGLIDNLPSGCCVEVPAIASKHGIRAIGVGKLPEHIAIMVNTSARCEELAVSACLEGNPEKVFQAVLFDPLTSAVLSMNETRSMVRQMLEKSSPYLKEFKTLRI